MLATSYAVIFLGVAFLVSCVLFHELLEKINILSIISALLGVFLIGSGISEIDTYYKSEHLEGYMKVIDQHESLSMVGEILVTDYSITVYANGVTMKCSVDSRKYNAAKDGKQEMFYVKYLRNEDNYYCDSVKWINAWKWEVEDGNGI